MASGIYTITHRESGRVYVGSAVDLSRRRRNHFAGLMAGRHCNAKLQRAWGKYGREAFDFGVMLVCSPDNLLMYEQRAIDVMGAVEGGYNIAPVAGRTLGLKHVDRKMPPQSAEARRNKSIAAAGRKMPPMAEAAKQKISAALSGRPRGPFSAETRAKMAAAKRGTRQTAAHRAAIAAALKAHWSRKWP